MKRFLKILVLLTVSLFVLLSGIDLALDNLSHSSDQNSVTVYNEKGEAVLAYSGNLRNYPSYAKIGSVAVVPGFLHRT